MTDLGTASERTILIGLFMVLMKRQWDRWRDKHRCTYCGADGGRHKQDCPFDYINREER